MKRRYRKDVEADLYAEAIGWVEENRDDLLRQLARSLTVEGQPVTRRRIQNAVQFIGDQLDGGADGRTFDEMLYCIWWLGFANAQDMRSSSYGSSVKYATFRKYKVMHDSQTGDEKR